MRQDPKYRPRIGASLMTAGAPKAYSECINTPHRSIAMTTIAHPPAKAATVSLRPIALVVLPMVIIFSLGWAFTRPAAPKPVGPEAAPVPVPPAVIAAPAQAAVSGPRPAPQPVPTPPVAVGLPTAEAEAAPAAPAALWGVPLAALLGLALGLKLRRTARFQPHALAR